jgi:ABC-type lipoprotein release transport system permease subunit
MNAFYFIFSRFRKLKSKKGFLSFNFYLSICLITFSLAAIIITDSLTRGYKNEIFSKISSLNPEFKIEKKDKTSFSQKNYFKLKVELDKYSQIIYSPLIEVPAIILSQSKMFPGSEEFYNQREGVYLFGVEENFLYNEKLISKYLLNEKSAIPNNGLIISAYLSKKINKSVSDEIDLLFYDYTLNTFIAKKFVINNIYNTQTQNDEFFIYTNINALNLNKSNIYCSNIIGYYEDEFTNLDMINDSNIVINNWDSTNISSFLNSFDIPIKLLMWILLLLSVYSLSSLIYNFLVQKKEDLKLLQILGYSYYDLRKIIVLINLYISTISIFLGIIISSLFIYLQNKLFLIKLPSEKIFQLSDIPAHFNIVYFIKYPIFILVFTIIVSIYIFNKYSKIKLK